MREDSRSLPERTIGPAATEKEPLPLTRDERSILVYAESCLVDKGGLLEGVRMNAADHEALAKFKAQGILDYGRIPAALLGDHNLGSQPTHWVTFTDDAWALAQGFRRDLSVRLGPYSTRVFAEVAERKADAREHSSPRQVSPPIRDDQDPTGNTKGYSE